jgi:hypothetical protein
MCAFLILRHALHRRGHNETKKTSITCWQMQLHVGTVMTTSSSTVVVRVATMEVTVALVIPTTLIKITNVRCVGSWAILLFSTGNALTKITLVLRNRQM